MGIFDALDKLMDDIENGALEKRTKQVLDKIEGTGSQALNKVEKLADSSEKMVKNASKLAEKADKTIDSIQKKRS